MRGDRGGAGWSSRCARRYPAAGCSRLRGGLGPAGVPVCRPGRADPDRFHDPAGESQPDYRTCGESLLRPGTEVGIGDFLGKIRVDQHLGSWCGPVQDRGAAPELQAVAEAARDDAVVLGIDVRDDRQAALDFPATARGLTYDSGSTTSRAARWPGSDTRATSSVDDRAGPPGLGGGRVLVPVGARPVAADHGWPPSRRRPRPGDPAALRL
ncbi:TlpA family protein disulfide reductase [Pseudonocardia sp. MCCB 268]|nr:TlpA family protein disulfide reductase [Pseudonocardia cytotoxica]